MTFIAHLTCRERGTAASAGNFYVRHLLATFKGTRVARSLEWLVPAMLLI